MDNLKNAFQKIDKSDMVYIPKFRISDVIEGGSDAVHPAFLVKGKEIPGFYLSKYQNVVIGGRAYSLPGQEPRTSIGFDEAKEVCEAKGAGWHLMTLAEWAAVALWCRKNGTMPKGNNDYGKDFSEELFEAQPSSYGEEDGLVHHVETGSGPLSWSHNGEESGIWDLNGNVNEWVAGYRTMDGELQFLENNDSSAKLDESPDSSLWKAILSDGSFAEPGMEGTLKWDYMEEAPKSGETKRFWLSSRVKYPQEADSLGYGGCPFRELSVSPEIKEVPELLKALALFPSDDGDYDGCYSYMRNAGERVAYRGGCYHYDSEAGVFYLRGVNPRTNSNASLGFRAAYIPED